MDNDPFTGPLVGIVEIDETVVGGRQSSPNWSDNKHWVVPTPPPGHPVRSK